MGNVLDGAAKERMGGRFAACGLVAMACFGVAFGDEVLPTIVEVSAPVTPVVFEGDLRTVAPAPAWKPGDPIKSVPRRSYPRAAPPLLEAASTVDPVVQDWFGADANRAFTTPTVSVAGLGFTGVQPPDPVGDIGSGHYIQAINAGNSSNFKIFTKTGAAATGTLSMGTLGTGSCANGWGDPIVLYDQQADRWLMTEFANGNRLCMYVSRSSDPVAGGWYFYSFTTPNFPDYPKYSVWADGYYMTSNEGGNPPIYAFDRAKMLAGAPATSQRFTASPALSFGFQAITPADMDGGLAPPSGSPAYFGRHRDDEVHGGSTGSDYIDLWSVSVDWTTPANSVITKLPAVAVSEFDSTLCGTSSFQCFQQPNSQRLDPLREVIMNRLQYRNFGSYETLVGNFVTDTGGDHGAVRWFELRRTGGSWGLQQEGTYSPDGTNRWMAGVSMDGSGDIALAYSVSSLSVNPGLRYTGRLVGDPAGTMTQVETTLRAGSGSQNGERWGDYSAMGVDPSDDCTFWYTNEYMPSGSWGTWIGAFKFDSCGGTPPSGDEYVAGEGLGFPNANTVKYFRETGVATGVSFAAYGAGQWGVNVAVAEVNGGSAAEALTGPGPGSVFGPQVRAFDRTGVSIGKVNFYAYGTLRYGVNVGGGRLDSDVYDEILSGAGPGAVFGPHMRGWNFDGGTVSAIGGVNFFAYSTLRYGVNVGAGDLDQDGFAEPISGPGPGVIFGPQVRGWNVDGAATTAIGAINFNAFALSGFGVNVAGGDVDGDGYGEIACGAGPGATHPAQLRGFDYDGGPLGSLAGYDITPYSSKYGARVGLGDIVGGGQLALLAGPGRDPGAAAVARAYSYSGGALSPVTGTPFTAFTGAYGVNLASGDLAY